jgi:hypothetical protein
VRDRAPAADANFWLERSLPNVSNRGKQAYRARHGKDRCPRQSRRSRASAGLRLTTLQRRLLLRGADRPQPEAEVRVYEPIGRLRRNDRCGWLVAQRHDEVASAGFKNLLRVSASRVPSLAPTALWKKRIMIQRLPLLYRSVTYSFRGGFLIRPFLIVLGLGTTGAVLSALEERSRKFGGSCRKFCFLRRRTRRSHKPFSPASPPRR